MTHGAEVSPEFEAQSIKCLKNTATVQILTI